MLRYPNLPIIQDLTIIFLLFGWYKEREACENFVISQANKLFSDRQLCHNNFVIVNVLITFTRLIRANRLYFLLIDKKSLNLP